MRLLPKSEVDKAKAKEQAVAVNEGVKLAKRIDNLREVAAEEETSLSAFRTTTLSLIHEEITSQTQVRDALKKEVQTLQEERQRLQAPLDSAWLEVATVKSELDQRAKSLDAREDTIEDRARASESAHGKTLGILARATTKEELATTRLREAEDAAKSAEAARRVAEKAKQDALALKEKAQREFTHRDLLASSRERDVTLREEAAAKKERENREERIRLDDRQATLERASKRLT